MERPVSPCGLACFNCRVYKDNITPELQKSLAASSPFPPESISCNGCFPDNPCFILQAQGKECRTLQCSSEKGVNYCFECDEFPCEYLMPTADGADTYPHNTKLYNLCTMKKIGIDKWCEIASDINDRYFETAFEIGVGAKIEDDKRD